MSRLILIDEITLDSTNVAASTESEFDYTGSTTYNTDDVVKVSYESDGTTPTRPIKTYEALADGITSYPPANPSKWNDQGPTNRWAMFDRRGDTQTENSSTIEVEIDASGVTALALFGLSGTQLDITHYDESTSPRTEVQSVSVDLMERNTLTWTDYFFKEFEYKDLYVLYLTETDNATLAITITASTTAKCAQCLTGNWYDVGQVKWEPEIQVHDYSKKETDDATGEDYLNPGNHVKKLQARVGFDNDVLDALYRSYVLVRGLPIVIDMNNDSSDYDVLKFYGYIRKSKPAINNPTYNVYRLEARGLI